MKHLFIVSLSTNFAITVILSSSHRASLCFEMSSCTAVAYSNMPVLEELGASTDRGCTGEEETFSNLFVVPVAAAVTCLSTVKMRRTALVK
jgi:hypothetical protein